MSKVEKSDAFGATSDKQKEIKIGLIKGRHPLPVDHYILTEDVTFFTDKELAPEIKDGIEKIVPLFTHYVTAVTESWFDTKWEDSKGYIVEQSTLPKIKLYITGLTIVTLIAMDFLRKGGYDIEVMGYDPVKKTYYSQGLFKRIEEVNLR